MSLQQDIDSLNSDITGWEKGNKKDLVENLNALNVKHLKRSPSKISLQRALKSNVRKRSGLINRISYSMPRHAVFLAKGVSKGHPITNPRQAKDWYNPVVDKNIPDLGDIMANGSGKIIINNLNIL